MAPTDREIWEGREWVGRRATYNHYEKWFDGTYLDVTLEKRDRKTGDAVKRYPLHFNIPRLACEVHRDLARGTPHDHKTMAVRTAISRGDGQDIAPQIETILNEGVWMPSQGGSIQQQALLAMNIFGGTVFKIAWEPWAQSLPYRLAMRLIASPGHIKPVWDWLNPWQLLECYIGYEIDPEVARVKYGIKGLEEHRPALYMEHWTPETWRVAINDRVPEMKWGDQRPWKLEGENPYGFVPIFYIPHERTKDSLFGDSLVPRQEGMTKELNARATDIADAVRAMRPGMYVGHDLEGSLGFRRVTLDGTTVMYVLDLGHKRPVPNAGAPEIGPVQVPDAPEALLSFPRTLLDFWMMICRISPAAFGLDDTRSGRITGPAIAQRMWTSIAHATTERINFSENKTLIDRSLIVALARKREALGELGVTLPEFEERLAYQLDIHQKWPPMIPLERADQHQELIDRLREGGISIEQYLTELGVEDVEDQKKLILEWQRALAEIEAETKAAEMEQKQKQWEDRKKQDVAGNKRKNT